MAIDGGVVDADGGYGVVVTITIFFRINKNGLNEFTHPLVIGQIETRTNLASPAPIGIGSMSRCVRHGRSSVAQLPFQLSPSSGSFSCS